MLEAYELCDKKNNNTNFMKILIYYYPFKSVKNKKILEKLSQSENIIKKIYYKKNNINLELGSK